MPSSERHKKIPASSSRLISKMRRLLLLTLLFLIGCGSAATNEDSDSVEKELPTIEVAVLEVTPQPWPREIRSQGNLTPDDRAIIGSEIEGRVDQVHVDLGDSVEEGTPLVTIKQEEFKLRVEQAEAELLQTRSALGLQPGTPISALDPQKAPPVMEAKALWREAKAHLDRAQQLQSSNSISLAEVEQLQAATDVAEARYRSAINSVQEKIALIGVKQAEVSLAKDDLQNTIIHAPFKGMVVIRQISPGTFVRVGDPAIALVRLDQLRFRGTIPERYALQLSKGQKVELDIESVPEPLVVEVTRISPAVDLANRSLLFEALIDNSDGKLRSGLFATGRVVTDEEATAIVVPSSALVEFAGSEKVWKVVDGAAEEQQVLTGERRDGRIEIVKGLQSGDVILQTGTEGEVARVNVTSRAVAENKSSQRDPAK
ncbi:Multidrug resistance protein MdtA precursor [Polystyrenella longa]|uniref:Multidrug resistance protein MdtA n=1 Tax=Polystyrenella longa TaxID=2528007 RepID=A0A518CN20_9PLAN|nr:efflux RND transporter periplasmic adaptor subunit [Polystyrenella longa]QDU80620.1 Multidrug resistance protein MdtA precursor [Polystyrenella longa]